jgi:predicted phosphate transport protein (TIGR00153 family)
MISKGKSSFGFDCVIARPDPAPFQFAGNGGPSLFKLTLIPREKKFFALFEQGAQNAVKIAQQLKDLVYIWENVKERVGVINDLEHQGDAITHQIFEQLHRTIITPFDREDIALLAHSLDDVIDFIHGAAGAMLLYKVERPTHRAKELVDIVVQAVVEVESAFSEIHDRIGRKKLLNRCVEINRLENIGDSVFLSAMAELFDESADIASLIKWREIYRHMESVIDRCEDIANILEGVAIKYA